MFLLRDLRRKIHFCVSESDAIFFIGRFSCDIVTSGRLLKDIAVCWVTRMKGSLSSLYGLLVKFHTLPLNRSVDEYSSWCGAHRYHTIQIWDSFSMKYLSLWTRDPTNI